MKAFLDAAAKAAAKRAEIERLKRASEQGFRPQNDFHGTMSPDIQEFPEITPKNFPNKSANESQLWGPASLYATDNPEVASEYSRIMYPGVTARDRGGEVLGEHRFLLDPGAPGSLTAKRLGSAMEAERGFNLEASQRGSNSYVTSGFEPSGDSVVQLRRQSSNVLPLRLAPQNTLDLDTAIDAKRAMEFYDKAGFKPNPVVFNAIAEGRPVNAGTLYYDLSARFNETDQGQKLGGSFLLNQFLRDQMGFDSMAHEGGKIMGDQPHRVTIMLDPTKIRSEFAQFKDPKSRNILAGGAAASGAAALAGTDEVKASPPETFSEELAARISTSQFAKKLDPTSRAILSELPNLLIGASGAGGLIQAALDEPVKTQRGERRMMDSMGPGWGLWQRSLETFALYVDKLRRQRGSKQTPTK